MNYDERTVVDYAEKTLKSVRSQRLVFPIVGALFLAFVGCLIWMIQEKSDQLGELLLRNQAFWAGFVVGALFLGMSFFCALGLVKTFRMAWGIEAAVYELAVRRGRENVAPLLLAAALLGGPGLGRADILYVANGNYGRIERFDSVTGANLGVFADLHGVEGLAFDRAGNLYAAAWGPASQNADIIVKITPSGASSVFARSGLNLPMGLAFDRAGNLYAANRGNDTIVKITPDGVSSRFASTGLTQPCGLAFDRAGNLYAANFGAHNIEKFTPDGVGSTFAIAGAGGLESLAFDSAGNLYVACNNCTIERFTPEGVCSVFASTGTSRPMGLAFDSDGNLYSSNGNNTIEKFSPDGTDLGVLVAGLTSPYFIAIPVPEPSAFALLALGLPALLVRRRR